MLNRVLIIIGFICFIVFTDLTFGQSPDFSITGFAVNNGGTTGGEGGETVSVSNYSDLKSYAESSSPYIILVNGTISNGSSGGQIRVNSDKSIIGVGSTAFLDGVGLDISDPDNIIIRNLRITLVGTSDPGSVNGGDCISISGDSRNIWIDHCEIYSEDPDVQTDIDKYDGLIDIKHQTGFITVSWCYLHDHHKGGLVGASDDDLYSDRKVTFHHNYYNKVKLRIPMYRGSVGHFFNNYIVGARDATEIRAGTCVRVEKNYYEELHYSIYTPTDARGKTERIDNIEVSRASRDYPEDCTADIPYDYSSVLTSNTEDVKNLVPEYAGVGVIGENSSDTIAVPGVIQAENYASMSGIRTEECSDEGEGENIGYIENGDWAEYNIDVANTANYNFKIRYATGSSRGKVNIYSDSNLLDSISIDSSISSDWQDWKTDSLDIHLESGVHTLKMEFTGEEGYLYNINWIEISDLNTASHKSFTKNQDYHISYELDTDRLIINISKLNFIKGIKLYSIGGRIIKSVDVSKQKENYFIETGNLPTGCFIIQAVIRNGGALNKKVYIEK